MGLKRFLNEILRRGSESAVGEGWWRERRGRWGGEGGGGWRAGGGRTGWRGTHFWQRLTRGLSILGRVGGAVSPQGVVVLADIEAASVELVHSSVVAIKAGSRTGEQEDIKGI